MSRVLFLAALLSGCALTRHPTVPAPAVSPADVEDLAAFLATPGPIVHEAHTSARWAVPLSGMVDLADPKAADLEDATTPILLPVHTLLHPEAGLFVIDTGIDRDMAEGGRGPTRGLVSLLTGSIEPVRPLGDIITAHSAPLSGVLITHLHLDHILGLPDVPAGTPIYIGTGETDVRKGEHALTRRTMRSILAGHDALKTWDPASAVPLGPVEAAWDVIGDGSLWALSTPGHTPGSTAFLARTTAGPVLFTGDTSHTLWGWEHGVTPGTYTADQDANRDSLAQLSALAEMVPGMAVFVGHELDGVGTGVSALGE